MTKIVANIVARNEGDKYLHRILERVSKQVDLITFTDDCSDDDTASIAKSYGCEVMVMPQPTFSINEGQLRQCSWEHLERTIGNDHDWFVLAIDCDEELYETVGARGGDVQTLRELANQKNYDVISVMFYHMWNETQYRVDKLWAPHPSTRFFRYMPGGVFYQRQLACGSEPTYVPQIASTHQRFIPNDWAGLRMKHLSYIKDEDKQAKFDRYASLDGGAFHAGNHINSILDKEFVLVDWEWE